MGGGGLISGVALALRAKNIHSRIMGSNRGLILHACAVQRSNQESVVEWDSIADGLSGKIEDSSITIPAVSSWLMI